MRKSLRQKKLLSLVRAKPFANQAVLRDSLEQAGFATTQSSLSRDLEELGIVKHRGHYAIPKSESGTARGLLSLDLSGENLVIARTEPGLASGVAVEIDGAVISEIVGTLAGEDTIFIAVPDAKAQRVAMKKIWKLFG
ncbi:MAG TPA: arginine repressor [Blastocatellia bacterium]|nr:arginine repressor [Blastocatellia bacterium]